MPLILNGSTGISGTDGSAGTPALQGTDGNTGMFFPAADTIAFAEGGVEAMRLNAAGNMGIGTTTPSVRLSVPVPTQNVGTSNVFRIFDDGAASSSTNNNSYGMGMDTDTGRFAFTAGNGGVFAFFTANTERARFDASGNFLVGTTNPGIGNNIGTTIEASGVNNARITVNHSNAGSQNNSNFMQFGYAGNLIGRIVQETTTTVLYVTSSDYRLKENVVPLTGAAARVQALKPCRFNFIETPGRTVDGFLAHEAAEVVPEAVAGEKDAVNEDGSINPQGIDQSRLVPLLTAALQEALTEIASLKARVAALEATP